MTFRRLYTTDGMHNYFWKARPVADGSLGGQDQTGVAESGAHRGEGAATA
jgi:hypothetical protein